MKHEVFEKNSIILLIGILVMVSIGGIVQLMPLFFLESTIEKVQGMRPYTPLEQLGRDIYVREGCYNCHSQMIRTLRDEVERYGHYSLAAESMNDHPFQWGSKRTGPDLARVGGKYSDQWHVEHMRSPKALVPESVKAPVPFLFKTEFTPVMLPANVLLPLFAPTVRLPLQPSFTFDPTTPVRVSITCVVPVMSNTAPEADKFMVFLLLNWLSITA